MQTQYKAYTLGEALCSTLNLVILTINFDFNIICVQCNVIRNFIHIIPTPIIRSHRGLTNVQVSQLMKDELMSAHYQITPWSHQCTSYFQSILNREIPVTLSCKGGLPVQVIVIYLYW